MERSDREDDAARARRAAARASWPGGKTDLAGQAEGELLPRLAPSERFGLVWQLTLDAWALSRWPTSRRRDSSIRSGSPRRIDLLTEKRGTFEEAWTTRFEVESEGLRIAVLGRGALIANKRAAGRPKDLLDVESLLAAAPPTTREE